MRSCTSTFSRALAVAVLLACAEARAQACCAGGGLLAPARLTVHEDALVALEARSGVEAGSIDGVGRFRGNARGAGGIELTQSLLGTLRVLREGQVTLLVPVTERGLWASGLTDWGGGLGDVVLSFRYDFMLAGESVRIPGLALLAGITFPTGRSPDQGRNPLGSDATGAGQWQGALGLGVEQTVGRVFLQGSGLVQQGLPRTASGVTETLGTTFSVGLAAGWAFDSGAAIAATATTAASLPAWVDGMVASGTSRWRSTFGLSGAIPLSDTWRLQGSLATQLPFGVNQPVSTTLSVLVMRTWS